MFYECNYCNKKLSSQYAYSKHNCEKKKKVELCRTRTGMAAFYDYSYWLKQKGNNVKSIETFLSSKFFKTFIEFQGFASEKGIPDKKIFISFMVKKNISPVLWKNKMIFDAFIDHFDTTVSPMKKVKISLNTLILLSDIFECDIGEVYDHLLPSEISMLIHERKLSQWLLLLSEKFKHRLHMIDSVSQHTMLSSVLDSDYWKIKFQDKQNKDTIDEIKQIINKLAL